MQVETHLPLGKVDPGLRKTEQPVDMARFHLDATSVEALGFDGLVLTETKEDPFVAMAMAATTTERIDLTTAVAIALLGVAQLPLRADDDQQVAWLQRGAELLAAA
jgi:hypothetical protein